MEITETLKMFCSYEYSVRKHWCKDFIVDLSYEKEKQEEKE